MELTQITRFCYSSKSIDEEIKSIKRNRLQTHRAFCSRDSPRSAEKICNRNHDTAVTWYHKFRIMLSEHLSRYSMERDGEGEADERYFGGTRKRKRGRGTAGKVIVFG